MWANIILWILTTFVVGSFAGVLGKRYGVEYPIAFVSALVVMAGVFANKFVQFGPFTVPAGVIVFSMTFFITDLICEKWGSTEARKAVWAGFFASFVLAISVYIVVNWPSAVGVSGASESFDEAMSLTPRIVFAGLLAYFISQHHDIWAFHFWKRKTEGKHLWLRNNLSTATSQLIDSVVFISVAFYGLFPVLPLILGQWAVKLLIALIDTPFMYGAIWIIDRVDSKVKGPVIQGEVPRERAHYPFSLK